MRVSSGALLAVSVSLGLFLLNGSFEVTHFLRTLLPTATTSRTGTLIGRLVLPAQVQLGSVLTINGQLPAGESGTITVEANYADAQWRLVAAVPASGPEFRAQFQVSRVGLLHLRLSYPDGHRDVGALRVVR